MWKKLRNEKGRDALQSHHITHPSEISYSPGRPSMPPDTKSRAAFVSKLRRLRTHLSNNAFVRHCLSVRHLVCHAGRERISVPCDKPHGKLEPQLLCLAVCKAVKESRHTAAITEHTFGFAVPVAAFKASASFSVSLFAWSSGLLATTCSEQKGGRHLSRL